MGSGPFGLKTGDELRAQREAKRSAKISAERKSVARTEQRRADRKARIAVARKNGPSLSSQVDRVMDLQKKMDFAHQQQGGAQPGANKFDAIRGKRGSSLSPTKFATKTQLDSDPDRLAAQGKRTMSNAEAMANVNKMELDSARARQKFLLENKAHFVKSRGEEAFQADLNKAIEKEKSLSGGKKFDAIKGGGKGKGAVSTRPQVEVELHGKKFSYNRNDLKEMIRNPKMYKDADNLPKWMTLATVGTKATAGRYSDPAFKKAYDQVQSKLKEIHKSKEPVKLEISQSTRGGRNWTLDMKESPSAGGGGGGKGRGNWGHKGRPGKRGGSA